MNNSFFSRFAPKEPKFFPLFNNLSAQITEGADLLLKCITTESYEGRIDVFEKIKIIERGGDELSSKILDELDTTFITPFDREDINSLAIKLYDVIHGINSCARRIALYMPKRIPNEAVRITRLIQECASYIDKAVVELDSLKKNSAAIKEYTYKLQQLEIQTDDVYENYVIKLFKEEKDSVEIIKLKEIINELENTTDTADLVGKVIRTIIIKYA